MSIIGIAELHNSKTENVEALYKKHQTNPNNNGVRVIDDICSLNVDAGKMVPGQLISIRIAGKERTFRAEIKGIGIMYFGIRTKVLTDQGFSSISDGTLSLGSKLSVYTDGGITTASILTLEEIYTMCTHYEVRIRNRDNYVLKNGVIIKAD